MPNKKTGVLGDEAILDLYFARNEDAIRATDDKYGSYLMTVAYNILHSRDSSEECLDDTYLSTWNSIPPERPSFFRVFLSRIMRNRAIDRYREDTAERRVPSELVDSMSELDECMLYDPSVDEETAVRELADILNTYLKKKGRKERFVFLCRYYYLDPIPRIAAMLRISERTVHRILSAMRAELRKHLLNEGYRP